MDREHYMDIALALAREAAQAGEVPVGCVICDGDGKVIGGIDIQDLPGMKML